MMMMMMMAFPHNIKCVVSTVSGLDRIQHGYRSFDHENRINFATTLKKGCDAGILNGNTPLHLGIHFCSLSFFFSLFSPFFRLPPSLTHSLTQSYSHALVHSRTHLSPTTSYLGFRGNITRQCNCAQQDSFHVLVHTFYSHPTLTHQHISHSLSIIYQLQHTPSLNSTLLQQQHQAYKAYSHPLPLHLQRIPFPKGAEKIQKGQDVVLRHNSSSRRPTAYFLTSPQPQPQQQQQQPATLVRGNRRHPWTRPKRQRVPKHRSRIPPSRPTTSRK